MNVSDAIRALLERNPSGLLREYYTQPAFAGTLFDSFPGNDPHAFTADDVVAVSLLDVRFGPESVRSLLIDHTADHLLAEIPVNAAIWDRSVDLAPGSAAWQLWDHLVLGVKGIGPTRASKLMARKRPHLFPILDSVIRPHLGLDSGDAWSSLREALADTSLRSQLDLLSSQLPDPPTTLRTIDVLAWMRYSESTAARKVRQDLGFAVANR